MPWNILEDGDGDVACFFCDTSDVAFGPIFYGPDAGGKARSFQVWLDKDPRWLPVDELTDRHAVWHKLRIQESA